MNHYSKATKMTEVYKAQMKAKSKTVINHEKVLQMAAIEKNKKKEK